MYVTGKIREREREEREKGSSRLKGKGPLKSAS